MAAILMIFMLDGSVDSMSGMFLQIRFYSFGKASVKGLRTRVYARACERKLIEGAD
jgi:hypothetical protein